MDRVTWKPGTVLSPVPVVMVSCGSLENYDQNIITIAWTGTVCSNPPMVSISVRPERHSYNLLKRYNEFVINCTTEELAFATDWCGVKSGRDVNKFQETKLTALKSNAVICPTIGESPLSLECVIKEKKNLGTHDLFLAEVVSVTAKKIFFNNTGAFDILRANPICYANGKYYSLNKNIGFFGYSIQKKKNIKKKL